MYLSDYLKEIAEITFRGDAREESYYSTLKSFLEKYGKSMGKDKTAVTVLPKKTEGGNPDFRVWDGEYEITGYVEAKTPGTNLNQIEGSKQLKRYLKTFPNLILTDFYEFRLYRNGVEIDRVSIGRPIIAKKIKTVPPIENEETFKSLLGKYFGFVLPAINDAETLAEILADKTHFLKDEVIYEELEEETEGSGELLGFFNAFQEYLISGLTRKDFADIFSQTLAYGLFTARTRATDGFNRELAYKYIPATIGILRDIFRFVSSTDLSKPMEIMIDDIAEVLQKTNVKKILRDFYNEGKGDDPIVHFYETFLNHYDPSIREKRGVYYTPLPVVHYIVKSVHYLLKTKFGLPEGLAYQELKLLDPAGGTLTFPVEAIKVAVNEYVRKYGEGGKHKMIKNQILKNYFAFELMMAPYAIGHMKIGFMLEELGYTMEDDDRFNLFLTNTFDMEDFEQTNLPLIKSLSEESRQAGKIKKEEELLVIIGNPPYSGHSSNVSEVSKHFNKGQVYTKGYEWDSTQQKVINIEGKATKDIDKKQKTFAGELLMDYFFVDEKPLGEKNPKWLQDDYVKFLRFAQWKIQNAGKGIVGMVTNHSYLDNPTFRGMRQSLMRTFDEIYILDLHGNSLKKETCPDGSADQNVFEIRQGVAIAIFVKNKRSHNSDLLQSSKCKIVHTDLFGKQDTKYNWLEKHYVRTGGYKKIKPQSPYYFFIKQEVDDIQHYLKWKSVKDIFPVNSVGIVTARDKLAIQWTENQLWNTIQNFHRLDSELARQSYQLGKDARDWKVEFAQKDLLDSGLRRENIKPILYRPFDTRYTYYTGKSRGFHCMPRNEVMHHMLEGENLALITHKRKELDVTWAHAFITNLITEHGVTSSKTTNYHFPLYLYQNKTERSKNYGATLMIFEPKAPYGNREKKPNIAYEILLMLEENLGKIPTPEKILYYIYGVLYSNEYREKYAEFLKIDFPRIPFTRDKDIFNAMTKLGQKNAELHLLKSSVLNRPIPKYEGSGTNDTIKKPVYKKDEKRVYINDDKYFSNIKPEVWSYHIGGYQVLTKYLKDRKGRSMNDPLHYCKVVTALEKTTEIQKEIDEVYRNVEKSL